MRVRIKLINISASLTDFLNKRKIKVSFVLFSNVYDKTCLAI